MNIYFLVLAQALRFGIRFLAAYLAYVGVTSDMQSELVEIIVTQVTPVILLVISEGWSYLQKRYFPELLKTAIEMHPQSSVDAVKIRAKNRSKAPVIY